jgi:hypothetical protein
MNIFMKMKLHQNFHEMFRLKPILLYLTPRRKGANYIGTEIQTAIYFDS